MDGSFRDSLVRNAAFAWLRNMKQLHGDVMPRETLATGFEFEGQRVPIVGPRGIFKPAVLPEMPLSITTIPGGPYDDDLSDGSPFIQYRYCGTNPNLADNVGLRKAYEQQRPLIYCYRVQPGRYLVTWPAFVLHDDPSRLTFRVVIDPEPLNPNASLTSTAAQVGQDKDIQRRYATMLVKQRLHQSAFRDRVLNAYGNRCSLCRLAHASLLDAAHIIPDGDPGGHAIVSNGLSLCKIHHAAYDKNFIGIDPNYKVTVRSDLMAEIDGPMLQHGLKDMAGSIIQVPSRGEWKPNRESLATRFEAFQKANA